MKLLTVILSTLILSGCAQESNPLLFGTTTSLGVAVNTGSGPDVTPGITVGYGREEVALVPTIVPNDTELGDSEPRVILAEAANDRQDALSTYANFNNDNSSGGAGVNQFGVGIGSTFATGVAAQYVALANLCSAGRLSQDQCLEAVKEAAVVVEGSGE